MRTTEVTCDNCGSDLTSTGNCEGWRISVAAEPLPTRGGVVTAMHIPRPLARDYHFCSLRCLLESDLIQGRSHG